MKELTRSQRRDIRGLVTTMCANYVAAYRTCLLNDQECSLCSKSDSDGDMCKYFKESVLPVNPTLEAALTRRPIHTKPCTICGNAFPMNGRQIYCSELCELQGKRMANAKRKRKQREKQRLSVTL